MTRPDLTDITLVLDRSGSMQSVRDATIEAFNGFITSQRTGAGAARVTMIQFDDQYEVLYRDQPIDQASLLTDQTFLPRGSTALLDALGRAMVEAGVRLRETPEAERPGTVLFVTLTDGEENSSHSFNAAQINSMIAEQRDKYAWQFVFLAANQDAIATAAQLGIGHDQALTMAASPAGMHGTMNALNDKMHQMRASKAAGHADAELLFDEEDRVAAAPEAPPATKQGRKGK